jgi:hypothetical protein
LQQAQAVFNGVTSFNPHQRGDFVLLVGAPDIGGGGGEYEIVGIAFHDIAAHGIDHLQGAVGGVVAFHVARRHVDGKELRAHAALFHARQIGKVVGVGFPDIHTRDGRAGDIVVRIDQDGGAVHAHHFLVGYGAFLASGRLRKQHRGQDEKR